jgi:hypothetical protein
MGDGTQAGGAISSVAEGHVLGFEVDCSVGFGSDCSISIVGWILVLAG